jgi:hypothetical protein
MRLQHMMAPSATSAAPASGKAAKFDVSSLFVADQSERESAASALASLSKNEGVELFASIGLTDALVKVRRKMCGGEF